jgi:hypothetical protein
VHLNQFNAILGYQQVKSKNYRKYFKKGKVFKTLWFEPANPRSPTPSASTISMDSRWGEPFLDKIRWFLVARAWKSHCLCVPIQTYGEQGTTKPGIVPDDHAPLVELGSQLVLLPGEHLSRSALHIHLENKSDSIHGASRVNFSKVFTIEYNIKVHTVGRIIVSDLRLIDLYFKESTNKEMPNDTEDSSSEDE